MKVKQLLTRTAGALGVSAGLLLIGSPLMAQVKIGDNPNSIDPNSILELESAAKGLLLPRVALSATNVSNPMTAPVPEGMHVYNTATATAGTDGIYSVSPGEYFWDGGSWVRLVTEVANPEVYREGPAPVGASCGSDPEGTIWNDILEGSGTEGQQWICRSGVWAVYDPPITAKTAWFANLSKTLDAGKRKAGTINRLGDIVVRRNDAQGSVRVVAGGGLRLYRDVAVAPNNGAFVDFARNTANPDLFRIGLRNDLNGAQGALSFQTSTTPSNQAPAMLIGLNKQIGMNVTDPKRTLHINGQLLLAANAQDGENFSSASAATNGIRLFFNETADRAQIFVQTDPEEPNIVLAKQGTTPGGSKFQTFRIPAGEAGSIQRDGNNVAVLYTTTSDRRLKENIKSTHYTIENLMKLGVVDYNYKSDATKTSMTGFIAQDLYEVFPDAVSKGGDNPKTNPWTVDYGKLTPLLVKAIQDQQKEIAALKGQLQEMNTLKAEVASIKAMLGNAGQPKSEVTISK